MRRRRGGFIPRRPLIRRVLAILRREKGSAWGLIGHSQFIVLSRLGSSYVDVYEDGQYVGTFDPEEDQWLTLKQPPRSKQSSR